MNRKRIVTVVLSSILALGAFAPAAFAGDWDRDHDRRGPDRHHGHDRRDWRDDRRDDRREWRQDRRYYSNGYREGYRDARYQDRRYDRNRVYVYDRRRTTAPARRRVRIGPVASATTARSMW